MHNMEKCGRGKGRPQGCSLRSHRRRRLAPLPPPFSPAPMLRHVVYASLLHFGVETALEIGAGHPNKRLMLGQIRHLVSCCAGCAERRGVNRMQQLRPPGGKEKIMGPPAQLVAAGGREVDRRCSQACALTGSTQKPQGSVIVVNHWGDEREPGRAPRSIKRRMGIALEPASKNPAVGSSAIAPSPAPLAPRRPALR